MPRQVRIEYPGAVYHAMARGDRREDIVRGDADREAFGSLLGELVGRTGWEMFAWVLMSNHYHRGLRTPEANLVAGMKWLQNTWTKRFNALTRPVGACVRAALGEGRLTLSFAAPDGLSRSCGVEIRNQGEIRKNTSRWIVSHRA